MIPSPARLPLATLPRILQGGMGAGVSGWPLARAVSAHGQLGVVSGTAIDLILTRRLQDGDPTGECRRALEQFPVPGVAEWIVAGYHRPDGRPPGVPYRSKPMIGDQPSVRAMQLLVAANFVEVFLAKHGHEGPVGINYLHKIQAPLLPSLYGAMLAGVEVVIVGAGVPRTIPTILDRLARGEPVELGLEIAGGDATLHFDPAVLWSAAPPALTRPLFFPIVSSALLARTMVKKTAGGVDGLIVEGRTAGGHNAPPRGPIHLDAAGEPIYGDRDAVDIPAIADLGVPFWLAGGQGGPGRLDAALAAGATGIQVGTLFAFCEESGLAPSLKRAGFEGARDGTLRVFTDPVASPTGFPFKVLELEGTASEAEVHAERTRVCDLGYLRQAYRRDDGAIGWRCPGEPVDQWVAKGGDPDQAVGRKCLCNALAANIGHAQVRRDGREEPALVTTGDDIGALAGFAGIPTAGAVVDHLLGG